MRKLLNFLLALVAVIALPFQAKAQGQIVINEVMQSNIDYLMVDNDFPDSWVELYNTTDKDINISGYYFGEKPDVQKAWKLPSGSVVKAHGYFLIYCDKEATGVHTDFRVDAGKAHLYLLNKNGEIVDNLDMEEMPAANIAYGRVTDGADEWQYEQAPSAGKSNYGPGAVDVMPEPLFSVNGGTFSESFTLEITKPEGCPQDAIIFYTTNGNEPVPGQSGVKGGMSHKVEISKSTVVRAKIVHPQYKALSRRSTTQSYIFHSREVSLPVVSIVSDRDFFYDGQKGILVSNVNDGTPNYMHKWRRPINVEYFDKENNVVFNQLGETAVSGVSTREQPQKSMKIYTNKRFGKKNFKGAFWDEKPEVNKVKSFVIRSGGNNSGQARINDALVQELFGTNLDDLDWQAYQPVIVYLNGIYLGEFGMRERSDENYVESNYDGLEDIEVADETHYQTPVKGSLFESFRNSYMKEGVTYKELEEQMDVENFTDALIAEMYGKNTDYPTNNVSMWRPLEDGGKWRWILKDMDRFGMMLAMYPDDFDMFRYMFIPDDIQYGGMHHFDLYAKMATFPEFTEPFIDKFSVYLGDFLQPDSVLAHLQDMQDEIAEEVKATFSTYNMKYADYNSAIKYLKTVIEGRPGHLYRQMASFFNLGNVVGLKINPNGCAMKMNGVDLVSNEFVGSYFSARKLRLASGGKNCTWKMVITHKDGTEDEKELNTSDVELMLGDYMFDAKDEINVTIEAVKADGGETEPEEKAKTALITLVVEDEVVGHIDLSEDVSVELAEYPADAIFSITLDDAKIARVIYEIIDTETGDILKTQGDLTKGEDNVWSAQMPKAYILAKGHTYNIHVKALDGMSFFTSKTLCEYNFKLVGMTEVKEYSKVKYVSVDPATSEYITTEPALISIKFDGPLASVDASVVVGQGDIRTLGACSPNADKTEWTVTVPSDILQISGGALSVRFVAIDNDGNRVYDSQHSGTTDPEKAYIAFDWSTLLGLPVPDMVDNGATVEKIEKLVFEYEGIGLNENALSAAWQKIEIQKDGVPMNIAITADMFEVSGNMSMGGTILTLKLPVSLTESGIYTIKIPALAFVLGHDNKNNYNGACAFSMTVDSSISVDGIAQDVNGNIVYTLSGVSVDESRMQIGEIYIVNGKKLLKK